MTKNDESNINKKNVEQVEYEEPPLEAFLEEEEDPKDKERRRKKKRLIYTSVAVLLSFGLLFQVFAVWFDLFNIDSLRLRQASELLSEDEIVSQSQDAVVLIQNGTSRGTGFVISADGYVLTNDHVVDNAGGIAVHLPDGQSFMAERVMSDGDLDVALLKIEGKELEYLTLSTEKSEQDDVIYVIGNPLLQAQIANKGTMMEERDGYDVLRISNPIYPGHSGSPVINEGGEVVGVVYARTIPTFDNDSESVGLAVPMEAIFNQMERLEQVSK
ncbi:S1C family serine protease [Alkalihalobacillus sp. 1P02AB]|uniref:S1C family serine protease n=1 Tax=Alkalihalobacillus sp. 1P02AB TaxID=3132260 RepID=UPI0039A5450D